MLQQWKNAAEKYCRNKIEQSALQYEIQVIKRVSLIAKVKLARG